MAPGLFAAFGEVFVAVEAGADWCFAAGGAVDAGRWNTAWSWPV